MCIRRELPGCLDEYPTKGADKKNLGLGGEASTFFLRLDLGLAHLIRLRRPRTPLHPAWSASRSK